MCTNSTDTLFLDLVEGDFLLSAMVNHHQTTFWENDFFFFATTISKSKTKMSLFKGGTVSFLLPLGYSKICDCCCRVSLENSNIHLKHTITYSQDHLFSGDPFKFVFWGVPGVCSVGVLCSMEFS